MATKEEYWKETMELLQDLFGNADAALRFHDKIPIDEYVTNDSILQAFVIESNICRHCKNNKIFTECRHYVRRTVDHCNGAFVESAINVKNNDTLEV